MHEPIDRLRMIPTVPQIGVAAGPATGAATAALGAGAAAGAVGGQASTGGGSGGYVFSPEEIDEVIKQWEDLRDQLEDDLNQAKVVADVDGPGREFASSDFESAARPTGRLLVEQTKRMSDYVNNYIRALKDAKNRTQAQDEQAEEDVETTGGILA